MNKNLQSPNHLQKKQEITSHQVANQILNQVPAKNLRNPDYYITSILTNPNSKLDLQQMVSTSKKGKGFDDYQKFRNDFEATILENLKKNSEGDLKPEVYRAEVEKFQKNYEEFYRGYTPDVNSFKRYDEIKKNFNQPAAVNSSLEKLSNDDEFQKNMQKFFGVDNVNVNKSKNMKIAAKTNNSTSLPKNDTELVKKMQNSKFNPITGKYN